MEIVWQPHQLWSYEPLKSTMFHEFCFRGWICVAITISSTLQPMDMRLVPLDTTIFCYTVHICTVISTKWNHVCKISRFLLCCCSVGGGRMRFMKLSLNWKRVFTTRLTHKCTRLLTTVLALSLESPMDLLDLLVCWMRDVHKYPHCNGHDQFEV